MTDRHERTITIGELAARTGLSVRAVRYYEQHGLLPAVRTSAGHRRFDPEAAETVRRIRLFLDAGLPLAIVARVLPCFEGGDRLASCVADYLDEHMDSLARRMEELDEQRGTLQRLQELVVA
ncbi:DNA-binding transcriptional MerR regulator [Naumannella cuiyingiana]|uniref:DNA-binding transcriptional MerR regulator n=1 Tax=Naumannella cuiyingiana TaxID=1347891 RepID=A0A7Z0IMF8_9ACTN|nr:MerR family transcriptional regulator [Naumannella cuiyingiana]NYI72573.1 DNA-binding transcriptional MerR regulator [Naumannella cuiyingiana]